MYKYLLYQWDLGSQGSFVCHSVHGEFASQHASQITCPGVCIQEGLLRGWGRVGIRASLHPGGGQTSPIGRPGILQDMVNKRAVRILLECFLVLMDFITPSHVLLVRMFWLCAKPIFITDIPKPFKKSKRSSGGSRISPRRGRQLPRGERQHTILPYFPKNCMKLKEFGPGGRASLAPPLRSATA